jgi:hypothetical protein
MTYGQLSNNGFKVVYDGGEFARTEKVEGISDWQLGLTNLRVCWAGPHTGKNCGVCEKCTRTKLNFLAVGVPLPPSLPGAPSLYAISKLRTSNEQQIALLNDIVDMATSRKINGPWLQALKFAVYKNKLFLRVAIIRFMRSKWWQFKKGVTAVPSYLSKRVPTVEKIIKTNAQTST